MSELIPWSRKGEFFPSQSRDRFLHEFDDLIDRFLGEEPFLTGFTRTFTPAMDISESDEAFFVKGEIPGIDPKDLETSLTGQVLTITGEKKEETEEKNGDSGPSPEPSPSHARSRRTRSRPPLTAES